MFQWLCNILAVFFRPRNYPHDPHYVVVDNVAVRCSRVSKWHFSHSIIRRYRKISLQRFVSLLNSLQYVWEIHYSYAGENLLGRQKNQIYVSVCHFNNDNRGEDIFIYCWLTIHEFNTFLFGNHRARAVAAKKCLLDWKNYGF